MDDLYHQQILDHYKSPLHFGVLQVVDHQIEEANHSCGDVFTYYIELDETKKTIKDISFKGVGCAISTAASSLLMDFVKGKPLSAIMSIDQAFMQQLIGAEITTTRLKCLMLPERALKKVVAHAS